MFEVKGSVIKQAGWRAVFNEKEETDEDGNLPEVSQGEVLPVLNSELLEKQTRPKPLHTEASLLGAMESCGKDIENEAEREAIKESGLGTPATRAAIIETLFSREYIVREKKSLVPTEKGLMVYETVKDKRIADVALTGNWENALAQIERGEMLPVINSELLEKQTKPKPLHTEASLLGAMESCGKDIENEAERAAMKESGIGTPATRAAIIETLFGREYIVREKKSLIPTGKGMTVYETVKDKQIADVALTGSWENALAQIERGQMQPETFSRAIEVYTRQITTELLNVKIDVPDGNKCLCPKCKTAGIRFYPKVAKCTDENCGLVVFRNICEKELSDKQITDLLATGKTSVIKGFKSKAGKSFDAALKFDENCRIIFDFPEKSMKFGKK
jgi:DNA topoisomerase IA